MGWVKNKIQALKNWALNDGASIPVEYVTGVGVTVEFKILCDINNINKVMDYLDDLHSGLNASKNLTDLTIEKEIILGTAPRQEGI